MKLIFLGTRGYIKARTQRHYRHASIMVSYYGKQVMINCCEDWLHQLTGLNAKAIFITHAHPDHVVGLKEGAPCPVYATEESLERMKNCPIDEQKKQCRLLLLPTAVRVSWKATTERLEPN